MSTPHLATFSPATSGHDHTRLAVFNVATAFAFLRNGYARDLAASFVVSVPTWRDWIRHYAGSDDASRLLIAELATYDREEQDPSEPDALEAGDLFRTLVLDEQWSVREASIIYYSAVACLERVGCLDRACTGGCR